MANDDDDSTEGQESANWRRDLERRARAGDEAQARLKALETREAVRSAGLDPNDKIVGLFVKSYDGDLTPEAIKDAASEYGLVKDDAPPPAGDAASPNPAQATMDAISTAAGSPVVMPPDIKTDLETAYKEGGAEGLLDQLEKIGVPVSTRQ